jgi:cytochrome P450
MQSFILLMMTHPDILKAATDEIDRVVGMDRMPTWDDEEQLPFVIACIKETLRRRPTVPTGMIPIFLFRNWPHGSRCTTLQ